MGIIVAHDDKSDLPFIDDVAPGSAAAKHGIQVGDKITHVNGKPLKSFEEFNAIYHSLARPVKFT